MVTHFFFRFGKILFTIIWTVSLFYAAPIMAQCPNDNNRDTTTLPPPPCAGEITFGIGAGTYAEIQVVTGSNYTFSTCGSPFDTYLTGYNGAANTPEFFNANNGPECLGAQASVNWTATFTGTLRLLVDVENAGSCIPCTVPFLGTDTLINNCPSYGSATLKFRQNNDLLFTSSSSPVCSGEKRILSASPSGGVFAGFGVTDTIFTAPDTNASFTITYTIGQCTISQVLTVYKSPVVSEIIGDSIFCPGSSTVLTGNALPGSGAISSYQWKFNGNNVGANTSSFTANQAGNYSVEVTNSNGCSIESPVKELTLYAAPTVNISGDSSFCSGGSGTLTANATAGSGLISSYVWKINGGAVGFNTPMHSANLPGDYTVVVTNSNGCSTESSPYSVAQNLTPTVTITKTDITCFELNNGSAAATVSGGTAPFVYSWNLSAPRDTSVIDSLAAGTYHVTVTDDNGCSVVSSDVTISRPPAIMINFGTINSTCLGDNAGSINSFVSGGFQPYDFMWSNGYTDQDIADLAVGPYTLSVTDSNGCVMTKSANVPAFPQPFVEFSTGNVCLGNQVFFSNTSSVSPGILSYNWHFGDGDSSELKNPSHLYEAPGNYEVVLTATSNNGCMDSTSREVTVKPIPDPTVIAEKELVCFGDSVMLTAAGGSINYIWNVGKTENQITVNQTGTYSVTVTNFEGCTATDAISITVMDSITGIAGNDTSISKGFSAQLFASTGYLYLWSPEESLDNPESRTPVATPPSTTTYMVTLTDKFDCFVTRAVTVEVVEDYNLIVPTLITPNGDGHNDFWVIKNITEYTGCEVHIFNRWGTEIYSSKEYQNDWDGTIDGRMVADGTYYYIIGCQEDNYIYKGSITILR